MKITKIETVSLRAPFGPVEIGGAHQRPLDLNSTLVFVHTDDGHIGVGESWLVYESESLLRSAIEIALAPLLLGEDPRDTNNLFQKMWWTVKRSHGMNRAMSALDQALWDIRGKACGEPVHRLLGSIARPVKAYGTTRQVHSTYAESLKAAADQGFTAVKMAAGRGVQEDIQMVEDALSALDGTASLAVDANGKYNLAEARQLADVLSQLGILWFEEPIPHEQMMDFAQLRSATSIPLAGFQEESTHFRMKAYLQQDSLDIFNVSLAVCGGLTPASKMSGMLEAWGRRLNPHGFGPPVMYAATTHLAASTPVCDYIEFPVPNVSAAPARDLMWGGHLENSHEFSVNELGLICPPDRPGLGVILDESYIEENRVL